MRILIVKTSSLGDIIHAFPVVSFLHREFPHAIIDWVVEKAFADIVKAHPLIKQVIQMDTKGWRKSLWNLNTWRDIFKFRRELQKNRYDVVIDLQGNTKSAIPTFLAKSSHKIGFGVKTIHEWPNLLVTHHRYNPPLNLNVRYENLYVVQHYFQRHTSIENEKVILRLDVEQQRVFDGLWAKVKDKPGLKILLCPGSAWKNKQLSYQALETFLLKLVDYQKSTIFIAWGSEDELNLARKLINVTHERAILLEKVSLPVLQNYMSRMDWVIAMDSLPLHLAGISGIYDVQYIRRFFCSEI